MRDESNPEKILEIKKIRSVQSLAHGLAMTIKIVAAILILVVGFLSIDNAPLEKITEIFTPSGLIKIGLFIFFFGWYHGATDDVEILKTGYQLDPNDGSIGRSEILAISSFIAIFCGLFWLNDKPIIFQSVLLFLLIINIISWRAIIKRTIPMIEETTAKAVAKKDEIMYLKCVLTLSYVNGRWQRMRFFTLFILAVSQLLLSILVFYNAVPLYILSLNIGKLKMSSIISYLPGVIFIIYVLTSELWMKLYRAKIFSDFVTLEYINLYFSMQKRKNVDWPSMDLNSIFNFKKSVNENYNGKIHIPFLN